MERFQEGDETAFETLYRRYFARLQRFCLKRVGDPHEAEEIAQEAFTRAYAALGDLAGERRFYPWMTVIAGRLCVDHHRRCGRTQPAAVVELGAIEGGQEAIVDQSDVALVSEALDRLAPRHREVLEMRERRGWTYKQIADHYEVPIGTVEALLFRARKALKREFVAVGGVGAHHGGAVAAIPLLGAIAKGFSAASAKVSGWTSALHPAVAPALGAAVVIGSAAVVATAVVPGAGQAPDRPPAVVRMVGAAPAAVPGSAALDTPTVGPAPALDGSAPSPPPAPTAPVVAHPTAPAPERPPAIVTMEVHNTSVTGYEEGAARAEEETDLVERVTVGRDEVLVALDVTNVITDLLEGLLP